LGIWGRNAGSRLPMVLEARIDGDDTRSRVTVKFTSDLGPYIAQLAAVPAYFSREMNRISSEFESILRRAESGEDIPIAEDALLDPAEATEPVPGSFTRAIIWTLPSIFLLTFVLASFSNASFDSNIRLALGSTATVVILLIGAFGISASPPVRKMRKWILQIGAIPIICAALPAVVTALLNPALATPVFFGLLGYVTFQTIWAMIFAWRSSRN